MFGVMKNMFIVLLTSIIVNASNHSPLHPNEYSQKIRYYSFAVKLDRCVGICDTPTDWPNKTCVPEKTEDLNLSRFNMIIGINYL